MVILTDGQSNDPESTRLASIAAAAAGLRTFSVGITPSVNEQELLDIAGGHLDRVFYSPDFDELLKLLRPVSLRVCDERN